LQRFLSRSLSRKTKLQLFQVHSLSLSSSNRCFPIQEIEKYLKIYLFFHVALSTYFRGMAFSFLGTSRSYSDTPHSVGLFWTRDQHDAGTSTWQHTTLTREIYPGPL
jgi:hypothetical protein